MTSAPSRSTVSSAPDRPTTAARLLTGLLIALFLGLIVHDALSYPEVGSHGVLVDFDAFYIVGELAQEGRAADAYDTGVMSGIQSALVGHEGFMPWTYPPPFDLLTLALPLAPRGLSYAIFTGATFLFYLLVIARLAPGRLLPVLVALTPPIYITVMTGQNSFLTGGLIGLFCLMSLPGRTGAGETAAGWPLGLLIIKPHLGIGLGVHALATGQWRTIALGVAIAAVLSLAATIAFGAGIWNAFLAGLSQASEALATDFYPLYRMTSAYAALNTSGVTPQIASLGQALVALGACALVVIAVRRGMPRHRTLALACFASVTISPYLYDYDMVVLGAGLALIIDDLFRRVSTHERLILCALAWLAGGWGLIHALALADLEWAARAEIVRETLSFGAYAYLLLLALVWRILQRPPR